MTPDSPITTPAPVPDRAGRRDFLHLLSGLVLLGFAGSRVTAMSGPGAAVQPAAEPGAACPAGTTAPGAPAPWEELSDPGWSQ
ncbi:MAG: hypothetical protein FJ381_10635 [Verrucomicrobia bacterium]|nr:hypothetical protein [Verrucomicrobiota bacterium]